MLEAQKAAQMEELKAVEKWKKEQAEKEKEGSGKNSIIDKMRIDQARIRQELEESGNSSSLSVPKAAEAKAVEDSYTTDEFEDMSMSGSHSKKNDVWSGRMKADESKSKPTKVDDSLKSSTSGYSVSNSKSLGELKSNSRIGESSDAYDDDVFDSMSKSHGAMNKALPTVKPSAPSTAPTKQPLQTL